MESALLAAASFLAAWCRSRELHRYSFLATNSTGFQFIRPFNVGLLHCFIFDVLVSRTIIRPRKA